MPSIKARIKTLEALLHTGQPPTPYEDLDPISKGLVDVIRTLEDLDTAEKREAYSAENGQALEQLEEFVRCLTADY